MPKRKCFYCGRDQICESEGRLADGSWTDDSLLPKKARNKWFCSYMCYWHIINNNEHIEAERINLTNEALEINSD